MSVSIFLGGLGRNFQSLVRWWLRLARLRNARLHHPQKRKTIVFQALMCFFPGQLLVSVRIQDTSSIQFILFSLSKLPNLMPHVSCPWRKTSPKNCNYTLRKIHVFQPQSLIKATLPTGPSIQNLSLRSLSHLSIPNWSCHWILLCSCNHPPHYCHWHLPGRCQVECRGKNVRENPRFNPGFPWKIYGQW